MAKKQPAWGATPSEWELFDSVFELTEDLLPVVSNPDAVISPHSKMVAKGKTPSNYNRLRQVVGIPVWTSKRAILEEVVSWEMEPDYGICIQTRHVRALDIDVEDAEAAAAIRELVARTLGFILPERYRENSGKCLLAFKHEGTLSKRTLKVEGGMIELLGNGQQFVAAGTHTSGVRYEWQWPDDKEELPELDIEQLELVWTTLVAKVGIAPATVSNSERKRGALLTKMDPVTEQLEVLGWGRDGQAYIRCPFDAEHTSDTGIAQTCYFPAGTGGYEMGHFKCLHAHCAGRNDGEFLDALGLRKNEFAVLGKSGKAAKDADELPKLDRKKNGKPLANVHNVHAILHRLDVCGLVLGLDSFKDEIMFKRAEGDAWQIFKDEDYTRLREMFDRLGFDPVGHQLIRDCVYLTASENRFDSARLWLDGLKWDGIPRIEDFAGMYLCCDDNHYTRATSLYIWTAMAGRVMEPGIKADMVPILVGPQGIGKSSAVRAMVPRDDFFTEVNFNEADADLARRMRGKLLAEIGELRGLHTRELESIKAFVTRTHEDWVPKFKEFATSYPRRMIFIGTTNQQEFLSDVTGNRRWLPLRIGGEASEVKGKKLPDKRSREGIPRCLVRAISRDCEQLWAEARDRFVANGVDFRRAEELGEAEHVKYMITDTWVDVVRDWMERPGLDGTVRGGLAEYLRSADVLRDAIGIPPEKINRSDEMRMAKVLHALGWEKKRIRRHFQLVWVWVNS